ncbi:MAG: hypothetical protein ACFCU3_10940 [Verrucomicrobiales bacterium]
MILPLPFRFVLLFVWALSVPVLAEEEEKSPCSDCSDCSEDCKGSCPCCPAGLQQAPVPDGVQVLLDGFVENMANDDHLAAFEALLVESPILADAESSRALRESFREALDGFGAVTGFELVRSEQASPSFIRLTHISLGKKAPLRWRFYFYQREESWVLLDLRLDDNLVALFDE